MSIADCAFAGAVSKPGWGVPLLATNAAMRGESAALIGFFLHFLFKCTKKGEVSAFSDSKSQKKRERPT